MADQLQQLAFLLQHCESFAKARLRAAGEFGPFGASVDGGAARLNLLGAKPAAGSSPATEAYTLLEASLNELAAQGRLGAYALAAAVNMPEALESPFADGIRICVEAPGFSRMIYTPYRVLPLRSVRHFLLLPCVAYGDEVRVDAPPRVFPAHGA